MKKTILIVEDDRKISNIVKVYLEHERFTTKQFEKGREAIKHAENEPPVMVILDLMLPDMTGEEVAQELREIGDFPIIMLTAKSSEEERARISCCC